MAEIINGLNKIEQITLGETVFGNGLNERLEQIDDNFQSIVTSEYLKGDSGTSFGYATFSNKSGFVNPIKIYHTTTNNEEELNVEGIKKSLNDVIGIGKDVGEFEFTFIYEIINGKKIAKSSLPFVYYDPSIYGISQDLEQGDYSCIVIFDGEFKKLNAFPTIYYNKEDDKFYWKINGIETKLTATGPKGERGLAGAFNIVFVRKDEKNKSEYIIEKFLYQNPLTNGYSWIDINNEMSVENKHIAEDVLRPGSPCIALLGEEVKTINEETGENEITNIIVVGPIILRKEDINDFDIYHVQTWDHMSIQHNMDASLLKKILDNIDPQETLKGLYVPASKVGNTIEAQHAFFKDSSHNNILNIKYVDNNFNQINKDVTIDTNYNIESRGYGKFNCGIISNSLDNYSGNSHIIMDGTNNINISTENGISMHTGDDREIYMHTKKLHTGGDMEARNILARGNLEAKGKVIANNGLDVNGKTTISSNSDNIEYNMKIIGGLDLVGNLKILTTSIDGYGDANSGYGETGQSLRNNDGQCYWGYDEFHINYKFNYIYDNNIMIGEKSRLVKTYGVEIYNINTFKVGDIIEVTHDSQLGIHQYNIYTAYGNHINVYFKYTSNGSDYYDPDVTIIPDAGKMLYHVVGVNDLDNELYIYPISMGRLGTYSTTSQFAGKAWELEARSDERLKNFERDIEIDFNKLRQLPKKYFAWKKDKNQQLHIGTSAQEVEKIYPELVHEYDENGEKYKSLEYHTLSIIALAAIDKLVDEIDYLKQEINNLKNKT